MKNNNDHYLTVKSAKRYIMMMQRWGNSCIICGHPFENFACMTKDHVVPRSLGGKDNVDNVAPSHFNCNYTRRNVSLIKANKFINNLILSMSAENRKEWLSMPEPSRPAPAWAYLPISEALEFVK